MKQLYMIVFVSTLAACGSDSDTSDNVQGLSTPSNISVVTAD